MGPLASSRPSFLVVSGSMTHEALGKIFKASGTRKPNKPSETAVPKLLEKPHVTGGPPELRSIAAIEWLHLAGTQSTQTVSAKVRVHESSLRQLVRIAFVQHWMQSWGQGYSYERKRLSIITTLM